MNETLNIEGGRLPARYWIQADSGLWFSVPRGSEAHKRDAAARKRRMAQGRKAA